MAGNRGTGADSVLRLRAFLSFYKGVFIAFQGHLWRPEPASAAELSPLRQRDKEFNNFSLLEKLDLSFSRPTRDNRGYRARGN
jgi:hypothetical protein